jgi:Fe2+ or Zn2+ uptake regulation protein
MSADVHAVAARRLALQAQRYTASRRAIVDRLFAAPQPLPIPAIVEGRRDLALSTVYRNLRVLEDAGVVARILTSGEFACFELAEDLSSHHHHLICRSCHAVADFEVPSDVEDALHDLLERVPGANGFQAERHRLDLIGVCADCR